MDFLNIKDKKFVVFGLANKKSVACSVGKVLVEEGAEVIHVVRSEARVAAARKLFPDSKVFICDVEDEKNIRKVRDEIAADIDGKIDGIVHSIAFANYSEGFKPFHETLKKERFFTGG